MGQRREAELVILNGMRWSNNILTEVVGNYGGAMSGKARALMLEVLAKLAEAQDEVRRGDRAPAAVPGGRGEA